MSDTPWVKGARSEDQGSCVEQRRHNGMVEVGQTKNPTGPTLRCTDAEFAAWLDGAKRGEFDHLVSGD